MMRFTLLGTGSSGGVPRFGGVDSKGDWGKCDPSNPRNRRQRCAMLVERLAGNEATRVCIDAGPDFRAQMLATQVPMLDALVLTHEHADHIHGIDDMRQFVNLKTDHEVISRREAGIEVSREDYFELVNQARIDCFAGMTCYQEMLRRFDYLFLRAPGSLYPPIMHLREITGEFIVEGAGGGIRFLPFAVPHGSINAYGFKIGGLVYLPDVMSLTDEARDYIRGCEVFIVDCLQFRAHGTHVNYETVMAWVEELGPRQVILTNLHNSMDYQVLEEMTPKHITPAYDGMVITLV